MMRLVDDNPSDFERTIVEAVDAYRDHNCLAAPDADRDLDWHAPAWLDPLEAVDVFHHALPRGVNRFRPRRLARLFGWGRNADPEDLVIKARDRLRVKVGRERSPVVYIDAVEGAIAGDGQPDRMTDCALQRCAERAREVACADEVSRNRPNDGEPMQDRENGEWCVRLWWD